MIGRPRARESYWFVRKTLDGWRTDLVTVCVTPMHGDQVEVQCGDPRVRPTWVVPIRELFVEQRDAERYALVRALATQPDRVWSV